MYNTIKVLVHNFIRNADYSGIFKNKEEASEFVENTKKHWGNNERIIKDSELPENLKDRIISSEVIPAVYSERIPEVTEVMCEEIIDEETQEVSIKETIKVIEEAIEPVELVPEYIQHLVKADYEVTILDLSNDPDFINPQVIEKRKSEYKDIAEVINIIIDHGFDSKEFQEYKDFRNSIKQKYPKI